MANDKVPFHPAAHTKIIEPNSDKQIVDVPLEHVGWGGRSSSIRSVGQIKNGMTLEHVKSKGK